jgi:hypothetical protein
MDDSTDPRHNHLLAALPHDQWQRWQPHLEHVDLSLGQVMYEAGSTLSHVYFPTTAIVSLLYVMHNGESAEIAVVGNEGVVGVSLFMVTPSSRKNTTDCCPINWRHRTARALLTVTAAHHRGAAIQRPQLPIVAVPWGMCL